MNVHSHVYIIIRSTKSLETKLGKVRVDIFQVVKEGCFVFLKNKLNSLLI